MEHRIGCSLRYISLNLSVHYEFQGAALTNSNGNLDTTKFDAAVVDSIGAMLMNDFIHSPFFYCVQSFEEAPILQHLSQSYFSVFNHFTDYLWFAKDNSINIGTVFCYDKENKKINIRLKSGGFSNAEGLFESTTIGLDELNVAFVTYHQMLKHHTPTPKRDELKDMETPILQAGDWNYKSYNVNNRIERALSFLSMARSNEFLPLKISLYIAVIACLFTTTNVEVTHKVCERVALYLGGTFQQKQTNFDAVDDAYSVRSQFFHGQALKKNWDKRERLVTISKATDNLLREILSQIILFDYNVFLDEKELPIFFKRLLLG